MSNFMRGYAHVVKTQALPKLAPPMTPPKAEDTKVLIVDQFDLSPVLEPVDEKAGVKDLKIALDDCGCAKVFGMQAEHVSGAVVSKVGMTRGQTSGNKYIRKFAGMVKKKPTFSVDNLHFKDGVIGNDIGRPLSIKVQQTNRPYLVLQSYITTAFVTSSTTLASFSATAFTVNSLPQIASLQAVFDQYRIARVEVYLYPKTAGTGIGANINAGLFNTVIDFDDITLLTTVNQALSYSNCITHPGIDSIYRTWVPHTSSLDYDGGSGQFAQHSAAPWLDAVSPQVYHYGLKTAWTATDVIYSYDALIRLHTEWRNIR